MATRGVSGQKVQDVTFGYNYAHFLNFPEQLASRMEDHQTTGNCVCHLIGAPIQGVAALALIQLIGGYYPALACTVFLTLWCLSNDLLYGSLYGIYSISSTVYQLNTFQDHRLGIYTIILMVAVAAFIQLGIGHAFFEGRPPNEGEGIVKGDGRLFAVLDLANEAILGTFHFYSLASLKLGYRPSLYSQVQKELSRLKYIVDQHRHKFTVK